MLEGFKVVELATQIAAPGAAGMLADWGAEVIKIENAAGDPQRYGFETLTPDGDSPVFQLDNRGKRSVVLDISGAGGPRGAKRRPAQGRRRLLDQPAAPCMLKKAGIDFSTRIAMRSTPG